MCSGFAKLSFLGTKSHKLHYAVFKVCAHTRTHTHIHTHNTHTHTHSPPTNIHHAPPSPLHTHFPHHAFPWACVKAGLPDHPDHQTCRAKKNSQFIKYARWHCNKHLHVRPATCTAKMIASIFTVASRYRRLTCRGVQTHFV